ncbi:MAG: acylphosphatase [Atopobiaceae bacterium]|jgi:acylphosphatase
METVSNHVASSGDSSDSNGTNNSNGTASDVCPSSSDVGAARTSSNGVGAGRTSSNDPKAEQPQAIRHLYLRFSGQVQGVGFRWNSLHVAVDVGLAGWVKNEWDGTVSMELQGTDEQIALYFGRFQECYRHYPIEYTISEKTELDPDPALCTFEVRYSS